MRNITVLKGLDKLEYMGSCVYNLSCYRQNAKKHKFDKKKSADKASLVKEELAFDIERHALWTLDGKLKPFTYSMMIDGYYPLSFWPWRRKLDRPTEFEFRAIASQLDGFVLEERFEDDTKYPHYVSYWNSKKNIFTNWSFNNAVAKKGRDTICIGVIQKDPIPEFQVVLEEIVPYAVSVFNQLSPTLKMSQEIVDKSIAIAIESDKINSYDRFSRISLN